MMAVNESMLYSSPDKNPRSVHRPTAFIDLLDKDIVYLQCLAFIESCRSIFAFTAVFTTIFPCLTL